MTGAAPRRLVLASPIEPSGASWILNVLLELGVRVRHRPVEKNVFRSAPRSMWIDDESGARLHPSCSQIEKWMPALTLRERFHFRDDVEVDYTQDLPPKGARGDAELVFLRDPRDALLSAYKRALPPIDYDAWLALPNPRTLLDRAANWALFARAWLARRGVGLARFEDYKADDRATFDAIARHLALDVGASDVPRALAASTFEKAREGELRYRAKHPEDAQIANRAGKVGESREAPELHAASQAIEARAADVLERLGYRAGASLGAASRAPRRSRGSRISATWRSRSRPRRSRRSAPSTIRRSPRCSRSRATSTRRRSSGWASARATGASSSTLSRSSPRPRGKRCAHGSPRFGPSSPTARGVPARRAPRAGRRAPPRQKAPPTREARRAVRGPRATSSSRTRRRTSARRLARSRRCRRPRSTRCSTATPRWR